MPCQATTSNGEWSCFAWKRWPCQRGRFRISESPKEEFIKILKKCSLEQVLRKCSTQYRMESDLVLLRKGSPVNIFSVCFHQGGRSWRPFGERKIIPQSFRRARIYKFSRQKRRFLQNCNFA